MAVKNIEMNYRNESGYDVLYPESILGNIVDWQDSIYSKSEVDGLSYKVEAGEYQGTQYYNNTTPNTITTSLPQIDYCFVFSLGSSWFGMTSSNRSSYVGCMSNTYFSNQLRIEGNTFIVSNYDVDYRLNDIGRTYLYICFCK